MPNSIGNASLKLSTNAGDMLSGLNSAGKSVSGWASGITGKLAGALKGGAAGVVGVVAGLATSVIGAITEPLDRLEGFGKIKKQADALGISGSQFQGISKQLEKVGVEGDQVNAMFGKLGKKISDAANGNGEAAKTFSQLGLNAQQLSALPLDEQFKAISTAIAKLPPGAQQASAAMHLFEESGARLLPVLSKGGAGIQDWIDQAKKSGAVLSDSQFKSAADAAKAWKTAKESISMAWDGLLNRAALIAAPIVKFIGETASKAFKLLSPVFEWIGSVFESVSEVATAVFEVIGEWVSSAVKWFGDLLASVFTFGDGMTTVRSVVITVARYMTLAFAYLWDSIKAGAGALAWVFSWVVQGVGLIIDAMKSAIAKLLELGADLPDKLGGSMFRDAANAVKNFDTGINAAGQRMRDWGAKNVKSFGDSAKAVNKFYDDLANKPKQAAEEAKNSLSAGITIPLKYTAVGAAMEGSKEDYSIRAQFAFESKFGDKQKSPEQKAADELTKANTKLDKMIEIWGFALPLKEG